MQKIRKKKYVWDNLSIYSTGNWYRARCWEKYVDD